MAVLDKEHGEGLVEVSSASYFNIVPRSGVGRSVAPIRYSYYLSQSIASFLDDISADVVLSAVPFPATAAGPAAALAVIEMDGSSRIDLKADGRNVSTVVICFVHAVTTFGPHVLWDVIHSLPVGGKLVLVEPGAFDSILHRDYFQGCLLREESQLGGLVIQSWTKITLLPSERDEGLEDWSFCVPMERFSRASVDTLLRDIERLELANFELVIGCSFPSDEVVDERVKIVVAPPGEASLTAKKNLMAEVARYPNLCIFHDRIALPANFKKAVERFGDHPGITAFQSLYVDWKSGRVERYSDMHVELGDGWRLWSAEALGDDDRRGIIYRHGLPLRLRWRTGMAEAHPGEALPDAYLTGTMYLTKRAIWQMVEQHPQIDWNELEDVEFGLYALTKFGIPSRINPFAFSISRRARALMLGAKRIADRTSNLSRAEFSGPPMMPPAHDSDDYRAELRVRARAWSFAVKHCPKADELRQAIFTEPFADQRSWAKYWLRILYATIIPRNIEQITVFLTEFSNAMFGFNYDRSTLSVLREAIWNGRFAIDVILEDGYFLQSVRNADAARVTQMPPRGEMLDYIIDQIWRAPESYQLPEKFEDFREIMLASFEAIN
jgi:hypothetical protein